MLFRSKPKSVGEQLLEATQRIEQRLASIVQSQFQLDPFQKMLFLFCGRRQDRIKGLYWEGDGFLLLYKRLENGAFQWPRNKDEVRQLTPQQYRWLMEGLKTEQPKANKAVSGLSIL